MTYKNPLKILLYISAIMIPSILNAQQAVSTNLVSLQSDGSLTYTADAKGNTIIDHGMVGYHQTLKPIPNVSVMMTLQPSGGDRTADIQSAIHNIEAMPLNQNKHRGTLLLKQGTYLVNDTIFIRKSGVVIRGEGNEVNSGTLIKHTSSNQDVVFFIDGSSSISPIENTLSNIIDAYLPYGAKEITVETGHSFLPGDQIVLTRQPNDQWIFDLKMHNIEAVCGDGHSNWTPDSYTISTKHNIRSISGNRLILDTPIVDPIGAPYSTGYVQKYDWTGIEECGIENLRIEARDGASNLETHARRAIETQHLKNGWFRRIKARDFINNCVKVENSYQITIDDCEMENYQSKITGGRRYG